MNRAFLSLFLILFTYFIVACNKDNFECSSSNTVNIPQVMRDYFFYKEGTWWVYKNVKDNTFDSMWVSQSSSNAYRGESDGFGDINKCYEHTVMGIDNIGTKGFMRWDLSNAILGNNNRFMFTIYWRDTSTAVEKGYNMFFSNDQLETHNPLHPIIILTPDSATIQNKKYTNLIEVDTYNYYYDNIKYRLFAKNAGLIKYIDRDSNQWELIKYSIIQ